MTVGERIRKRREELHITQSELAAMCGYSDKTGISHIENNRNEVSLKTINKLTGPLQCTSAYLLGWENDTDQEQVIADYRTTKNVYDLKSETDEAIIKVISNMSEETKKNILAYAQFMAQNKD